MALTVIGEDEYRGYWWLPGREDNRLSGTLEIADGRCELHLLGDFGREELDRTDRTVSWSLDLAEQERIVGVSTKGKPITLEGHQGAPHEVSLPGIPTSTYIRRLALVGKEFEANEAVAFDELEIEASDLNEWTRVSGFKPSIQMREDSEGGPLRFEELDVKFSGPEEMRFELARGDTATLTFRVNASGMSGGATRVSLEQEASLRLRSRRKMNFDDVATRTVQIRNLLSLAVGRPVSIRRVYGYIDGHNNPSGSPRPIQLFWDLPFNPEEPETPRPWHQMLFTLPEASPNLSSVLRKWLARQRRLAPVFDLFFGVRHNPGLTLEVRFLAYAQALETYDHRRRPKAGRIPLARRVETLLGSCRTVTRRLVDAGDLQAQFISNFVRTRNYYTHYTPGSETQAAHGVDLLLLSCQLEYLLEMLLLHDLGFACRDVDAIFERALRYADVEHFKRLASSP